MPDTYIVTDRHLVEAAKTQLPWWPPDGGGIEVGFPSKSKQTEYAVLCPHEIAVSHALPQIKPHCAIAWLRYYWERPLDGASFWSAVRPKTSGALPPPIAFFVENAQMLGLAITQYLGAAEACDCDPGLEVEFHLLPRGNSATIRTCHEADCPHVGRPVSVPPVGPFGGHD